MLYNVDEELEKKILCNHGEGLALAFVIINVDAGSILGIIKNLHECGDCHNIIRLISKLLLRNYNVEYQ